MEKLRQIWKYVPDTYKISYWVCLILTAILLIWGFIVPPPGQIDNSVLVGAGILFAFASLAVGKAALERGVDAKIKHGETELTLSNPDGKNGEN